MLWKEVINLITIWWIKRLENSHAEFFTKYSDFLTALNQAQKFDDVINGHIKLPDMDASSCLELFKMIMESQAL